MQIPKTTLSFSLFFLLSWIAGCSFHFSDGQELEKQERWEEASIEYRLAFVESPSDPEIIAALKRSQKKVAEENLARYRDYLKDKEFRKAYVRLEAAAGQDPTSQEIKDEQQHWTQVLLAGKVDLQLDRLLSNIRLADEMQMQILINTPAGKQVTADISNETGIFFYEDVLYKKELNELPHYSIHMIGLKLSQSSDSRRPKVQFRQFVSFRGLILNQSTGQLQTLNISEPQTVLSHRNALLNPTLADSKLWFPPGIIHYNVDLKSSDIQVISEQPTTFMPQAFYANSQQKRAFVDFGNLELTLDPEARAWGIQKKVLREANDDYFYQFSQNLALYPYFFYQDGVYRYLAQN